MDSAAPSGWVLAAGGTIGSAASGGTTRANDDTATLFAILWALDATLYPILTSAGGASSRGASAAADFAANKRMTLPDLRGRVVAGKDNAGGSAASRLTTAKSGVDGVTLGASGGVEEHTLTSTQIPSHSHAIHFKNAGTAGSGSGLMRSNAGADDGASQSFADSTGGGAAHPNAQPTLVANPIIKL
jgi:microcystin-dependent protein